MLQIEEAYNYCKSRFDTRRPELIIEFGVTDDLLTDAFHDSFLYTYPKHDVNKGAALYNLLLRKIRWKIITLKDVAKRQSVSYLTMSSGTPCPKCYQKESCKTPGKKTCSQVKAYAHSEKGRKHFHKTPVHDMLLLESLLEVQGIINSVVEQDPTFMMFATELCSVLSSPVKTEKIQSSVVTNILNSTNLSRCYVYAQFKRFLKQLQHTVKNRCFISKKYQGELL